MRWLEIAIVADVVAIGATVLLLEPSPTLAIPAIAAVLPLFGTKPGLARLARIAATSLVAIYAILGLMTAGLLFVPAALAMGASVPRQGQAALPEQS